MNARDTASTLASATYVNLAVADLAKSKAFFEALGFAFDPQFTDPSAACLALGPSHYAMLLNEARFKDFTPYPLVDAHRSTEVLVALQLGSRAQVEQVMAKALAAGGNDFRPPDDHGWMYGRAFQDLDGHIWEIFFMDVAAMQAATRDAATD
jgi:predicted lactoylglutathione lyase